jgi:hemolysin III
MSREEFFNMTTHAAGILASAVGGALLIVLAVVSGNTRLIVGVSVFVATLLLLYSASTLYHAATGEITRQRLKVLDHASIYLLIAGSYTPFTLAALGGAWGWSLFGVIWGLAVAGVIFKLFFTGRFKGISTLIYIAMGWLIVIAIGPLVRALDTVTLAWLVAGGLTYTFGTIFYMSKRTYSHAVWHLFVLGGSVCHAVAVGILAIQ